MIDKASELLQWFVSLSPDKSVIAILVMLVIYFGWVNFNLKSKNEILQTNANLANIECATKVSAATIEYQERLNEQTDSSQKRYDDYRDRVEKDNLERIRLWEEKYNTVGKKLENAQNKQLHTEELVRQITKKLK